MLKIKTLPEFSKQYQENLQNEIQRSGKPMVDPKQILGFDSQPPFIPPGQIRTHPTQQKDLEDSVNASRHKTPSSKSTESLVGQNYAEPSKYQRYLSNNNRTPSQNALNPLSLQAQLINLNNQQVQSQLSLSKKRDFQRSLTFNPSRIKKAENNRSSFDTQPIYKHGSFRVDERPFALSQHNSSSQDYYIGTGIQPLDSTSSDDNYYNQGRTRSLSEQMSGVSGLVSLSVKLGEAGLFSSSQRNKRQALRPNQVSQPQSPTIRAITSRIQEAEKKLLQNISRGLKAQQEVYVTKEGLGGTYFFRNERNEFAAIVKPIDEEPLAPNNPKGYIGRQLGDPGWKSSIRVGEAAVREQIAYLLDRNNSVNVPTTLLAKIKHPTFNYNDPKKDSQGSKICSVQKFVNSDGDCGDIGYGKFSKVNVQRIGLLDIRIFNTDRHAGNILYRKSQSIERGQADQMKQQIVSGDYNYQLIPIDHGFCLPESLECPYFEWLYWPQPALPLDPELKQEILDMDIEADMKMIQDQIPQQILRKGILRMYYFSATFLKMCVQANLNLFEIGKIMSEPVEQDLDLQNEDSDADDIDAQEDVTELIKCANAAINIMGDKEASQEYAESCDSVEEQLKLFHGLNNDINYSDDLFKEQPQISESRPRVVQYNSQGGSAKSLRSQSGRTCKLSTFTLPEDRQLDYDLQGMELDTPHTGDMLALSNKEITFKNSDLCSVGGHAKPLNSLPQSGIHDLSGSESGLELQDTPRGQIASGQTIQKSPFQNFNMGISKDKADNGAWQESSTATPRDLSIDYEGNQAQSLAHYEPFYFDQAMRNRTNPIKQIYTQQKNNKSHRGDNTGKVQPRFRHLYSNYVKANKSQTSICFENFSDREFSVFMREFAEILQENLEDGLYRDSQGADVSRLAYSVPY